MADRNLSNGLTGENRAFGFLRHHSRVIIIGILVYIVSSCLLWGLTLWKVANERAVLERNALREVSSLSNAYADQLLRSVEQLNQITLSLKYYWRETRGALWLEDHLKEGLYPESAPIDVGIVDRDGNLATSTYGSNLSAYLGSRKAFRVHREDRPKGLLVSDLESVRGADKNVIRFTRRLEKRDGSFDGVVQVAVEPAYLTSFTDEYGLGKRASVAVRKLDGTFLAIKAEAGVAGADGIFRSPPVFEADKGLVQMPPETFVDNQPRIVAWQKLENYPFVSIIGLSRQEVLAPHAPVARSYYEMAAAGSVFLLLMAITGMSFSLRLAWRKQQAHKIKDTYRLATDAAREGFFMVRAIYGRDHSIVDFVVEDCNERGAEYYGTTRAQLLGTRFTEYPADAQYAQDLFATYRHAMETGFHEDDFRVTHGPVQAAWIHRRLVRSGDGLAVTLRDVSDIKANEEALLRLANADAVTSLPNRHWLMNYLPLAVERARSGNTSLALLFIDLDDFKNINDTLGHAAGDQLLQAAAARLKSIIRPQDSIVRLGGDEFILVLDHVESNSAVSRVADRIVRALGEPFLLSDHSNHLVHASIGISMFPQDGDDGETLLKHADIAMYAAKANGKGRYQFFDPKLAESLVTRLNREQSLRLAIDNDEFVLYYQPRVDTFTGELRSMEALVRWVHPERGLVPPLEFIPVAEETGLVVRLGELVIKKACAQLAQWKADNLPVVPVSINVSPRQINKGRLSPLFALHMADFGIDPSLIEIEITESCMVGEDPSVNDELAAIEALGTKVLVDDFGTGYSSLSQLKRLDMDGLKVDRAFTSQLGNGKEDEAVFRAILSMAHALEMTVVAEGVETFEQLHILQRLSCNEVQGYLISRPVPAGDVPSMLRKRFLLSQGQKPATA
jgi:diguanylate cyclase (GGDEF)-like protein